MDGNSVANHRTKPKKGVLDAPVERAVEHDHELFKAVRNMSVDCVSGTRSKTRGTEYSSKSGSKVGYRGKLDRLLVQLRIWILKKIF